MAGVFPLEPWIRWADLSLAGEARWDDVDRLASQWLGRPCLALPSVRVGLCWALEAQGLARHRDHVLLPRFVGRCILNSISRVALPVEEPSSSTRAAIVVDQFGLRQQLDVLVPEFQARGWQYVEDSPYGIGHEEAPAPGSLGRFIGLGKVLPIALGALLVTDNAAVEAFVRRRREERSAWSGPVWLTMLVLRARQQVGGYSVAADAAYELYVAARGGHRWLRGNLAQVLGHAADFEREAAARLESARSALGDRGLVPDLTRLPYVLPCFVGAELDAPRAVFRRAGFDDSPFHVDVARNMLAPNYTKGLLLPLNPRIPRSTFDAALRALEKA